MRASGEPGELWLDPFTPRLQFACSLAGGRLRTGHERTRLEFGEPLDTAGDRVERVIDFERLEATAGWQTGFKPPRPMTADELPSEVTEQMTEREPQFFLRNIARAERHADPEERVALEPRPAVRGLAGGGHEGVVAFLHRPPELLGESSVAQMARQWQGARRLYNRVDWTRHVCRELRGAVKGPLWRYDPDAPPEDEAE